MRTILKPLAAIFSIAAIFLFNTSNAHYGSKGPYGGNVSCIIEGDTNIYIGTNNGGVFKSTNTNFNQWRPIPLGLGSGKITSLAFLNGKVFAGTADSGVYVSTDAGSLWNRASIGLTTISVLSLRIFNNTIYAGTTNGIYRSTNGGQSWTFSGLLNVSVSHIKSEGPLLLAGTNSGVYMSSNGESWMAMNVGLSDQEVTALHTTPTKVYVGTKTGVFVSDINNLTWVPANTGLINPVINTLVTVNNTIYAGTNGGVFSASESTLQWSTVGTETSVVTALYYKSKLIAGIKTKGIFTAFTPFTTWTETNSGFNNLATSAFITIDTNIIVTSTEKGVFVSRNLATTYTRANKGLTDSTNISSFAFGATKLYASSPTEGVFVSSDTGKSWNNISLGLPSKQIKKLVLTNTHIFAATGNGHIYSSPRNNISWSSPLGNSTSQFDTITDIYSNGTFVIVSTHLAVFVTSDGISWNKSGSLSTPSLITSLTILENEVFVGTNGSGIYKSQLPDLNSWQSVSSGLQTNNILSLAPYRQYIFAGFRSGVFVSPDKGANWDEAGTQANYPTYADPKAVNIIADGKTTRGRIFASTPYNSLYSNSLSELPTGLFDLAIKEVVKISISPNPTQGSFALEIKDKVTALDIIDLAGNVVQQLPTVEFQYLTLNTPKGFYLLRASTSKGITTKKFVIE